LSRLIGPSLADVLRPTDSIAEWPVACLRLNQENVSVLKQNQIESTQMFFLYKQLFLVPAASDFTTRLSRHSAHCETQHPRMFLRGYHHGKRAQATD